jgi:hypothetical protein
VCRYLSTETNTKDNTKVANLMERVSIPGQMVHAMKDSSLTV